MGYIHKVYAVGDPGKSDHIKFAVSFTDLKGDDIEPYIESRTAYASGLKNILEPKLKYFRMNIEEIAEVANEAEFEPYDPVLRLMLTQEKLPSPQFTVTIPRDENYIRAHLRGDITKIEREALAKQWEGQRARDIQSFIGRLINIAGVRTGNFSLHGGAAVKIDSEPKDIRGIISRQHAMGKTTALLYLLQEDFKLISNNLRCKVWADGKVFLYPQHYPNKYALVRVRKSSYNALKDRGFDPKKHNIEELIDPVIPTGPNDMLLKIKTYPDKLKVTDDFALYLLWPKASVKPDVHKTTFYPAISPIVELTDAWEATWDLKPIYEQFGIDNEQATRADRQLAKFWNIPETKARLDDILNRCDRFAEFEGGANFSKELDKILKKNGKPVKRIRQVTFDPYPPKPEKPAMPAKPSDEEDDEEEEIIINVPNS